MNFFDYKITSNYGTRQDPITGEQKTHYGIDYGVPLNTEINSNVSGIVTESSYDSGYGNYVVVKDGTGRLHYYAHLNKRSVNVGDTVNLNSQIGLSGSTGRSTGPHLHYEVKSSDGTNVNPNYFTTESNVNGETFTPETNVKSENFTTENNVAWYDIKGNFKNIVLNIFKFIIMALLIILFVIFITKALDISII